jgi:hypothetical protein
MTKAAFNRNKSFYQKTELQFKEGKKTGEVLHLKHSIVWV